MFELFVDVSGHVDEVDDDVEEDEDKGGDVVAVVDILGGDLVRAIFAGGGPPEVSV